MRKRRNTDHTPGAASERGPVACGKSAPTPADDALVLLGRIVAAHGLGGQVKILSFTEAPENIVAYGPLSDGKGRTFQIEDLRVQKGEAIIASLAGVTDRAAAERLRGVELRVSRGCLPIPDEEEWYYDDLIGLTAQTPDGQVVGEVASVQNFGAGDLLELRRPGERHTIFLAFTHANVPNVDVKGRRIIVVPPDEIIAAPEHESDSTTETP